MIHKNAMLIFLAGLVLIIIIDTLGAIASRKFNFKYSWLSVFSFAVYIGVGYFASKQFGFDTALFINALLGIFDSTVGQRLSFAFKANTRLDASQMLQPVSIKAIIFMIGVAGIFTALGYLFLKI